MKKLRHDRSPALGKHSSGVAVIKRNHARSFYQRVGSHEPKMGGQLLCLTFLLALCGPVCAQPVITRQPASQTNVAGSTATFSVEVTATSPPAYQWFLNNKIRPGAIEQTLVITNVQTTNFGLYSVVVSNIEGSVTSHFALLTVIVPPSITVQPASQFVDAGVNLSFSVTAVGTLPLGYQWRFNQSDLPGETRSNLFLGNAQLTNQGAYSVVVSNIAGVI